MELTPNKSFLNTIRYGMWGYDSYTTPTGTTIWAKKGQGKFEVNDKDVVIITGAKDVCVKGTNEDDKIYIKDSKVLHITPKGGNNEIFLDNCKYYYNKFWGTGSTIKTGTAFSTKKGSDVIKINGDFEGRILAQQGAGRGYGDDKKAHKDTILINGNNNGYINIDTHDKVAIKGKEKGRIVNNTTYYI